MNGVFGSPFPNGGVANVNVPDSTPVGPNGGGFAVTPDGRPDYQAIAAGQGGVPAFYLTPPPAQPNFGGAAQPPQGVVAPGAGSPVNPNHMPGANGFGPGRTLQF